MNNVRFNTLWIYTTLKLTYANNKVFDGFNTLWIYTALKQRQQVRMPAWSFNTLWIYTALKRLCGSRQTLPGFNTLWIYTALKLYNSRPYMAIGFNTLWIYTALKLNAHSTLFFVVSIPSEFTLLSNRIPVTVISNTVSIPSEFTLLSNTKVVLAALSRFQYPLNLHCSQTISCNYCFSCSFNTLWIYTALKLCWCAI